MTLILKVIIYRLKFDEPVNANRAHSEFHPDDGIEYMILLISHENIDNSIDIINFFTDLIDQDLETEHQDDIIELYNFIVITNIDIIKGGEEYRSGHNK